MLEHGLELCPAVNSRTISPDPAISMSTASRYKAGSEYWGEAHFALRYHLPDNSGTILNILMDGLSTDHERMMVQIPDKCKYNLPCFDGPFLTPYIIFKGRRNHLEVTWVSLAQFQYQYVVKFAFSSPVYTQ